MQITATRANEQCYPYTHIAISVDTQNLVLAANWKLKMQIHKFASMQDQKRQYITYLPEPQAFNTASAVKDIVTLDVVSSTRANRNGNTVQ